MSYQRTLICLIAFLIGRPSRGDLLIQFDLDPNTSGIQADLVDPVGSFTADIVAFLDAGDTLSSYSVTVQYDATEMSATGATQPAANVNGFDQLLSTPMISGNEIRGFAAATLDSNSSISGPASFVIGSIEFNSLAPAGAAGEADIWEASIAGLDGAFNGAGVALNVTSTSSSVSAIPEPSAFWMVSLVVFGIGAMRVGVRNSRCAITWSCHRPAPGDNNRS